MDSIPEPMAHHEGSKEQFLAAYDAHADSLYRFCLSRVSTTERAEDIVQETFTKFWQELRKGVDIKNERAFLYRLARNSIIDWYRKKKEVSLDARLEDGFEVAGLDQSSILDSARLREVHEALTTLDDASREVVQLRYVEGWTPLEIAALTGESANVISVRLTRALAKLRTTLHVSE